jgi:hypothetical protein
MPVPAVNELTPVDPLPEAGAGTQTTMEGVGVVENPLCSPYELFSKYVVPPILIVRGGLKALNG